MLFSKRFFSLIFLFSLSFCFITNVVRAEDDEDDSEPELFDPDAEEAEGDGEENDPTEVERDNFVYVLNDDNFDSFMEGKSVVLLEFYAPWCGHCKQFAPTYEKIAEDLDGKVDVAKVDATIANGVANRFNIQGYPTIKIWKDGETFDYKGSRSKEDVIKKVMEYSDPDWSPPPAAVITLTTANFRSIVDNEDIMLVEFYAPWCGHCKKLEPEYEEAAQELKNHDPPIPLGKVDATEEGDLASEFGVSGYPTMKLFRRGRAYEYKGPREARGIISYMIDEATPPSTEVTTLKVMKNILHIASDVTIIGCFMNEEDPALEVYQQVGNTLRSQYEFHHTFSSEICSDLGASIGEVIMFHPERFQSQFEPKSFKMPVNEETVKNELETFFSEHAVPLVGQRTKENKDKRYEARPLVVVYYSVDFSFDYRVNTQIWRKKVLNVANEMKDVTFCIANEDDFTEELKRVKLDDSPEEINVIIYDDDDRRYPMKPDDEFDEEVLSEYVGKYLKGKIKPVFKSEKPPKKNKGPVTVVTANTFDQIVMDESKDLLIEFYAPWCGHCKKLAPVYKKLGKKFKDNENIVIAKMDATANDIPNNIYKAEGFPTLYWAPAGSKTKPSKYTGGRELDAFVEYIEENSTQLKLNDVKDEL